VVWIDLAPDRDQWRVVVNTAMNLRVPQNVGKFLRSYTIGGFSRRAQLHRICQWIQLLTQLFNDFARLSRNGGNMNFTFTHEKRGILLTCTTHYTTLYTNNTGLFVNYERSNDNACCSFNNICCPYTGNNMTLLRNAQHS
jgi:hypothetical protein